MRSWVCTLVPIALTSVFATSPYSRSRDPSWDASAERARRRSKAGGMFAVRSLGRSSRAGFGSVALPIRNSVADAHRQPFADDVHRRLTLPARKPRNHRPSRGCFSSPRDLSNWRPAPGADAWLGCQQCASSSTSSSSSSTTSSSSSSSSSSSTWRNSTRRNSSSSSSSSSSNGDYTAGTSGSHANADNQRAAQDGTTTTVTPHLGSPTNNTNALLASWPASLSPTNTGKMHVSEIVRKAAQWLELHGVVDPEPSAAELLAKAARYRSPQDMSSRLRVASQDVPPSLEMTPAEWDEMRRLCELRAAQHVPVQYLVGEWDFYGLSLEMQPPTLIPRPETEELVDRVLQWVRQEGVDTANNNNGVVGGGSGGDGGGGGGGSGGSGGGGGDSVGVGGGGIGGGVAAGFQFLDVGSGTGAIGLTLLKELPEARCVAIDAQPAAVRLSRRNAERTGLQPRYSCFHEKIAEFGSGLGAGAGDGFGAGAGNGKPNFAEVNGKVEASRAEDGIVGHGGGGVEGGGFDGSFDFIVSNPPYIPKSDMEALPPDVADHEDSVALDGGEDGLDVVRDIVRRCPRLLRRGGPRELWMEVDTSHPEAMQRWLGLAVGGGAVQECEAHGVTRFEWMSDMSQRPRFVRLTFAEDGGDADGEEG